MDEEEVIRVKLADRERRYAELTAEERKRKDGKKLKKEMDLLASTLMDIRLRKKKKAMQTMYERRETIKKSVPPPTKSYVTNKYKGPVKNNAVNRFSDDVFGGVDNTATFYEAPDDDLSRIVASHNRGIQPVEDRSVFNAPMGANSIIREVEVVEGRRNYAAQVQTMELNDRIVTLDGVADHNEVQLFYRVLDRAALERIDQATAFSTVVDYPAGYFNSTTTVTDVIAHRLINCLDITNMKHEFNGKFHCIFTAHQRDMIAQPMIDGIFLELPGSNIERGQDMHRNQDSFTEGNLSIRLGITVKFELLTVHNSTFGTLNFVVNGHNHSLFNNSMHVITTILSSLVHTGGLAGYDWDLINVKFGSFLAYISSSTGRLVAGEGGVRFYKTKLGPYSIDYLSNEGTAEQIRLRRVQLRNLMWNDYYEIILKHYDNYDNDNDIGKDFKSWADTDTINRRIETASFRFLPQAIRRNPRIAMDNIIQYKVTQIIPNAPNPIPIQPSADRMLLDPLVYMEPAIEGDPYSTIARLNSDIITGNLGFVAHSETLDNQIEQGLLDAKLTKPMNYEPTLQPGMPPLLDMIAEFDGNLLELDPAIEEENVPYLFFAANPNRAKYVQPPRAQEPHTPPMEMGVNVNNFGEIILPQAQVPVEEEEVNVNVDQFGQPIEEEIFIPQERRRRRRYLDFYGNNIFSSEEEEITVSPFDEENIFSGCIIDKKDKLEVALSRLKQLWSPPPVFDNNCFLRCLLETRDMSEEAKKNYDFIKMREDYGVNHLAHITVSDYSTIAKKDGLIFKFYHILPTPYNKKTIALQLDKEESQISHIIQQCFVVGSKESDDNTKIHHFLIHRNHCYLLLDKDKIITKVKCSKCAQWINRSTFSKHNNSCFYCIECRRAYHTKEHKCVDNERRPSPKEIKDRFINRLEATVCDKWVNMKQVAKGKKITTDSKIWAADMEGFPDKSNEKYFIPYAIGICCMADKDKVDPVIFYGDNCMEEYLKYITENVKGKILYFNGSAFDNFIHIKGMVDHNYYIDSGSFIKANSRIISFNHNSQVKVIDLCLFLQSSLAKACKDWGVPADESKKEFDHEKVFDMESAMLHEKEVREYLKYDVLSLLSLTKIFHTAMWKCFSMDVLLCVTPAQFSLKVWSSTCEFLNEIYIPHQGKEEDDDRAAYYGGRVMCQRKEFRSADWQEGANYTWDYENVDDYLVLGDVNSLYPAAQVQNDYAYGKWTYEEVSEKSEDVQQKYVEMINQRESKGWMKRCVYLVDVYCPKDLITAFLMDRSPKGDIIHNLEDKVKKWYWGTELMEAIKLGYRVTKVWSIKEFEKCGFIFSEFVNTCWEGRKKTQSGSAQNTCFKFTMNGLTGKFGQKSHPTSSVIYSTNYKPSKKTEVDFDKMIANVVDFEPVFSANGDNNTIILEVSNKNQGPSYPVYLSAQILANARVLMSKIMRTCDAYRNPARAIYYTDTDSLVMTPECIPDLIDAGYIGKGLGQIKCDLNGSFNGNQFAKIVRGVWAATKGPYSLVFLLPGDNVLKEKVKVKGIPHTNAIFKYHDDVQFQLLGKKKDVYEKMVQWLNDPSQYNLPAAVIGTRFYLFKSPTETYFAKNINFKIIQMLMKNEGELFAYYGGMKRNFHTPDGQLLMIRPDCVMRTVCSTNWWSSGKRIYLKDHESCEDLSYPIGYCIV